MDLRLALRDQCRHGAAGLFETLDKYPNLKIIAHHLGAMVPYFEGRVGPGWDQLGKRTSDEDYSRS